MRRLLNFHLPIGLSIVLIIVSAFFYWTATPELVFATSSVKDKTTCTGTTSCSTVHMNTVNTGDSLFVGVAVNQAATNRCSVTDSKSNTYTRAGSFTGTSIEVEGFYAINATVDTATTATITCQTGDVIAASWFDVNSLTWNSTFDQKQGASGTGTNNIDSTPAPQTAVTNELVIGIGGQANNRVWTAGTNYTSINSAANGASAGVFTEYQTVSTIGNYNATASLDVSSNWVMGVFTFKDTALDTSNHTGSTAIGFGDTGNGRDYMCQGFTPTTYNQITDVGFYVNGKDASTNVGYLVWIDNADSSSHPLDTGLTNVGNGLGGKTEITNAEINTTQLNKYTLATTVNVVIGNRYVVCFAPWNTSTHAWANSYHDWLSSTANPYAPSNFSAAKRTHLDANFTNPTDPDAGTDDIQFDIYGQNVPNPTHGTTIQNGNMTIKNGAVTIE